MARYNLDLESGSYRNPPIHIEICLVGLSLGVCIAWLIYGILMIYLFGV